MVEELGGGTANAGSVVRDGDLVWRPTASNSDGIHALLGHLAGHHFEAPYPVAVDRNGMDAFRYIDGEVSVPPYREEWVRSDETLASLGRLLRSYHEAAQGFDAGANWSTELADPAGGTLVCHNDVCIENVVVRDGFARALLDFDFAAPGRPIWDVAMTARYWLPLLDPVSAEATGRQNLDVVTRTRLFADAYGLDHVARRQFGEVLEQAEHVALRFVLGRMERGDEPFIRMWRDLGGEERHQRKLAWLHAQLPRIQSELL